MLVNGVYVKSSYLCSRNNYIMAVGAIVSHHHGV